MSKINYYIDKQAFEIIRNRIGEILADEFNNQFVSFGSYIDPTVTVEAINPEDKEDLPVVNVSFAAGSYTLKDYSGKLKGTYTFNIDGYANHKTSQSNSGDYASAALLQRILGIARAILEDPQYKTLGFVPPFIHRVYCSELNIANSGKNDSLNSMMGRLSFVVETQESVQLIPPTLAVGYDTQVKIDITDDGYKYSVSV